MKRKELTAIFNEICSRVHPIKGMYSERSTEKERIIGKELDKHMNAHLATKEKDALEALFLSSLDQLETEEALANWYNSLTKYYTPEQIPDTVYIRLIALASQKKFKTFKKLLEEQKQ